MSAEMKIKLYLVSNGISQTFLSGKTGIPSPKLSRSLKGKRKMSLDEYELVCGALGVGVDQFLEPRKFVSKDL